MEFRNFDELIKNVQIMNSTRRVAVVLAHDEHTLQAVLRAKEDRIIVPILIGDGFKIREILQNLGGEKGDEDIIHATDDNNAAEIAVELVHQMRADLIMKGKLQTADFLKAVVNREKGLGIGGVMSHVAINEVPDYHKLLVTTDGGMLMYPDLAQKKCIVENAVNALRKMGYEQPKVAVLAAVETVNEKMPETLDAEALKQMNKRGELIDCVVEGPISYDLAVNRDSALVKGYSSVVAGDADILVVPNITTGNILGKSLVYSAKAKMAGFVAGAKVPVVLTSRGATAEEKYLSLVLAASAANG